VKKPRILIVEDEFLVALELAAVLTDAQFDVLQPAPTIDAALQMIGREAIDAAILDCNIGGRDVTEVAESLAQRRIPFIFVTGYGPECLPLPFRNTLHISKPFDEKRLVACLRAMLHDG